jgi:hypothetical protein
MVAGRYLSNDARRGDMMAVRVRSRSDEPSEEKRAALVGPRGAMPSIAHSKLSNVILR